MRGSTVSAAARSLDHVPSHTGRHDLQIVVDGQRTEAASAERYTVHNPANGQIVGSAPLCDEEDARCAVEAAAQARERWKTVPLKERVDVIDRAIDSVEREAGYLATLLTQEQGKPLPEAVIEVAAFVARMRAFARLAGSSDDGRLPTLFPPSRSSGRTTHPADGVTAGLVAWNFPVQLMAKKVGPPLLAGGTVVLKPAFTTPLTTLRVIELMHLAGMPSGVLNCITGRGDRVGAALAASSPVVRVHVTGSDETGRSLRESGLRNNPDLVLGLAGSDAMIVCRDADLPKALNAAVTGRFQNAGQICKAVKRLFVASEIYEEFTARLVALVALREAGDGTTAAVSPRVRMGPLHTRAHREGVHAQLRDAVSKGAEVLIGGQIPVRADLDPAGHYFEPTLVINAPRESRLFTEEVFGPVLPICRTDSTEEAIQRANDSAWRLGASIWTSDKATASFAASQLRAERVWVNRLAFGSEDAI